MTCPNCGHVNPAGAHYCQMCGLRLDVTRVSNLASGADAQADLDAAQPSNGDTAKQRAPSDVRKWAKRAGIGCAVATLLACNLLLLLVEVPNAVVLAASVIAAVVPALLYARWIVSLDKYEREPRRTIIAAFGWGALVATLFAGIFNAIGGVALSAAIGQELDEIDWLVASLVAPLVEESLKGLVLIILVVTARDEFDTVLDGFIYGALAGVGFAMTENIYYFGHAYLSGGWGDFTILFAVRSITGEFGHAMWAGTTGLMIGLARGLSGRGGLRMLLPICGWALAVGQHATWNASLSGIGSGWVALVSLLLGVVWTGAMWRVALGRERHILREQLADEVVNGTLTAAEYEMLWNDKLRRKALREARRRGGRSLRRQQRRFFQAAAELAFRKYHRSRGERPKGTAARFPEDEYRAQLAAVRLSLGEPRRRTTS